MKKYVESQDFVNVDILIKYYSDPDMKTFNEKTGEAKHSYKSQTVEIYETDQQTGHIDHVTLSANTILAIANQIRELQKEEFVDIVEV